MEENMDEELTREINEEIDRLLESQEVLEEFEKVFPKEIVRADPKERPFEVTEENLGKIFDILNRMFFGNKLKKVPLIPMTLEEANVPIFEEKLGGAISTAERKYMRGLNVGDMDNSKEKPTVFPGSEFIYIQLIEDKRTSFGYILATLLHEMIHNYDNHYGDVLLLFRKKITTGFIYDDHETKVFRKYMKMANNKNIQVVKTADESYELSNEEAQKYLLDLPLGEVKIESTTDKNGVCNSMRAIKISKNRFRFFIP